MSSFKHHGVEENSFSFVVDYEKNNLRSVTLPGICVHPLIKEIKGCRDTAFPSSIQKIMRHVLKNIKVHCYHFKCIPQAPQSSLLN